MAAEQTLSSDDTTDLKLINNLNNNCLKMYDFVQLDTNKKIIDDEFKNNFCVDCTNDSFRDMEKLTDIQKFYHGKNVLITGGTGFLGKILVEKLLRSCPGIENIYLLVRQKRGKDIYTRIEEIFDDAVFDRLKKEVPKFRHKILPIPADCEAAGLGLSLSDRQILTEKVNIIFHSAATVKFDEHLRCALLTNVRSAVHMLRLARDIKSLDVIMHVSTAYSYCHLPRIEECFYTMEADSEQLFQTIEKLSDKEVEQILPKLLGPWPNTYTFTKALAEKELKENADGVALGIFRPAIVTSTYKEPLKCWIDNMYGPTGVAVGSVTGILRSIQCHEDVAAEIVPVDFVVNSLIAASHSVHKTYKQSSPSAPPIFNYVSSIERKITWGEFSSINQARVARYPFSNAMWYLSLRMNRTATMNSIYVFFLHLIPAALIDGLAICIGKKPKMLKVYRKVHKFAGVLNYFCTREIDFCNRRTRQLWDDISEQDKQIFPFSMSEVRWEEYFDDYFLGIRRYLFKESDDTLPQARLRWKRLYYLHQIVKCIFYTLSLYALWSILSFIFQ